MNNSEKIAGEEDGNYRRRKRRDGYIVNTQKNCARKMRKMHAIYFWFFNGNKEKKKLISRDSVYINKNLNLEIFFIKIRNESYPCF